MKKKLINKRFVRLFLAWISISTFMLFAFLVIIIIETLARDYPKWQWWMSSVPVNVISDAFMPVVDFVFFFFSIPVGFIALLFVLSYLLRSDITRHVAEIVCYLISIAILWFGFWAIDWQAECVMLSLQSADSPFGGFCGSGLFTRPLSTFIWQTIIWVICSVSLLGVWIIIKRKLLFSQMKNVSDLEMR